MKAVSLFSGVGGFEVGFERAGIETVLQAEQDPLPDFTAGSGSL